MTLAPKEYCSCASTNTCYPIITVRMNVGLEPNSAKMVYNLTKLRVNNRNKPDRYAGKKKPRPIDRLDANETVIIPAPDSTIQNAEFDSDNENEPQFVSSI